MHHGTSTTPLPPHLYRPSYTRNPGHEIEFPTCSQPVAMEGGWGWVRYGGFQSSTNETNGTNATALSDSASEPEGIDEQVILNCPVGFNGTVMLECESNQGPKPTLVADTCELLDPEGIALSLHGMDALQYGALKLEQKVARDEAHRFQRTAAGVNALRTDIDLRQQRLESDLQSLHRLANQATKTLNNNVKTSYVLDKRMNEDQTQFDRMAGIFSMQLSQTEEEKQRLRASAVLGMVGSHGTRVYNQLRQRVEKDKQAERRTYLALIENLEDGRKSEDSYFHLGNTIEEAQTDLLTAFTGGAIAYNATVVLHHLTANLDANVGDATQMLADKRAHQDAVNERVRQIDRNRLGLG